MFRSEDREYELPLYSSPEEIATPEKSEYSDDHSFCPGASGFQVPPSPPHRRFHSWRLHEKGKRHKSKARKVVAVTSLALAGFSLFTLGRIYEDHTALQNIHQMHEDGFRGQHFGAGYGRFPHHFLHYLREDLPPERQSHHEKGDGILAQYPSNEPGELSGPKYGRPRYGKPRYGKPRHHKPKHHKSKHNESEVDEKKLRMEHGNRRFRGKKHHFTDIDSEYSDSSDEEGEDLYGNNENNEGKKFENNDSEKLQNEEERFKTQEENPRGLKRYKDRSKGQQTSKPHLEKDKELLSEHCSYENERKKFTQKHKTTGDEEPNPDSDILSEMEEIYNNIKKSVDSVVKSGFSLT